MADIKHIINAIIRLTNLLMNTMNRFPLELTQGHFILELALHLRLNKAPQSIVIRDCRFTISAPCHKSNIVL